MNPEKNDFIFISYKEFGEDENDPSIRDYLAKSTYMNQDKVINFLRNGKIELARLSRVRDIFTGERIPYEVLIMSDGNYFWSNTLAWYVEKYNLRMPEEFERYILSKSK